jgi:hypothetical protein
VDVERQKVEGGRPEAPMRLYTGREYTIVEQEEDGGWRMEEGAGVVILLLQMLRRTWLYILAAWSRQDQMEICNDYPVPIRDRGGAVVRESLMRLGGP